VSPRGNGQDDERPEDDASRPEADVSEAEPAPDGALQTLEELPPSPEQLEQLRRERDELKDALLRRRAEFDNFRKRSEREQQAAATEAAAGVLRRLLETLDNLERALAAPPGAAEALRHGVELTLHDLSATLEALGVSAVDPRGLRFDPLHHQALLHEPVPGFEEGMVAEVFRKGYLYKDRLLRPALVKVASGGAAGNPIDAGGGGEVQ
jgi:molecular chaperone GrpE